MRLSQLLMSSALSRITEQQFVSRQAGNGTMLLILKERQRNDNGPQTLQLKYMDTRALKIIHFINSKGTFFKYECTG